MKIVINDFRCPTKNTGSSLSSTYHLFSHCVKTVTGSFERGTMMKKSMVYILLVIVLLFTTTLVGFAANRSDFNQDMQQKYSRQMSGPVLFDVETNIATRKTGARFNLSLGSEVKIDNIGETVNCRIMIARIGRSGRASFRNEKESMTASLYANERLKFTGVRGTSGTLVSRQEFKRTSC